MIRIMIMIILLYILNRVADVSRWMQVPELFFEIENETSTKGWSIKLSNAGKDSFYVSDFKVVARDDKRENPKPFTLYKSDNDRSIDEYKQEKYLIRAAFEQYLLETQPYCINRDDLFVQTKRVGLNDKLVKDVNGQCILRHHGQVYTMSDKTEKALLSFDYDMYVSIQTEKYKRDVGVREDEDVPRRFQYEEFRKNLRLSFKSFCETHDLMFKVQKRLMTPYQTHVFEAVLRLPLDGSRPQKQQQLKKVN